jgi:nucleoside-diphosphate-sugar epimerase
MMRSLVALVLLLGSVSGFTSPFIRGTNIGVSIRGQSSLCMKTIAVFGASGLTASECVYQALENGDSVVGLTRNPSKLVIPKGSGGSKAGESLRQHPNLTLIGGDVTKMSDVEKVFDSSKIDGVVVALGGKTSDVGDTMLTDGTKNVIQAMKSKGVKRLAVVTSIGTGDSENQAPFFFKSTFLYTFYDSSWGNRICLYVYSHFVILTIVLCSFNDDGHEENFQR